MRGREFLMKDNYSFDLDFAGARRSYDNMFLAYLKTFRRMDLTAIPMRAASGAIGGDMSHEFQVLAPTGESEVFYDAAFEEIDFLDPALDIEQLKARYAATDERHDPATCPVPPERLRSGRGIEVGQIFYFGTKYSKPLGATVMGPDGQETPVEMGSYGIGVSRLVGALIEVFHDEAGILWPEAVAPFKLGVVNLRPGDAACDAVAAELEAGSARRRGAGRRPRGERRRQVRRHGPDRPAVAGGGRAARRQAGLGRAQGAPQRRAHRAVARSVGGAVRGLMFAPVERLISGRYLRPRREEGFISVIALFSLLGIALGVGTLIVVLAVMSGFRAELLGRVLGLNGHLTLRSRARGPDELRRDRRPPAGRRGRADRHAAGDWPGDGVRPRRRVGCPGARHPARGPRRARDALEQCPARLDRQARRPTRSRSARAWPTGWRLDLGDRLTLISPQGTPTAFGTVPRVKAYEIGAIFEVGMFEYDNTLVFMPLEAAQLYFQLDGRANELEIMVADPDQVAAYRREFQGLVGDVGQLVDWQQANASFFTALKVERNVMFLILSLIIMVAAFNIISGMIMLVKDKGRDIAILRTMGATRGSDHAGVLHERRRDRRHRDARRLSAGARLRRQHRDHPPLAADADRDRSVLGRDLLPLASAGADRGRRRRERGADEPRALAAGDALPVLAGRPARSGRGVAL